MSGRSELKWLAGLAAAFLALYFLPVGTARFDGALLEAFQLAKWYAREHVLLCLVPAFFIAGAISSFVSQAAVMKYLGPRAPKLLAYVASKGAVIAMTRSMARELGADAITVNAVAPGLTLVEATEYIPADRHRHYVDGRAIQRQQLPADVCGAVTFLLSDAAGFITGQLLAVNGGFVMH